MGEMKITIPDDVEKLFRKIAMIRFGYQKGAISQAAKSAIKKWASESLDEEQKRDAKWDKFVGILKHIKKTSVELQHEARDSIIEKHAHRH